MKTRLTYQHATFYVTPVISVQRYIGAVSFGWGNYVFQISFNNFGG